MDLQVVDNFLSLHEFRELESAVMGVQFPWYYHDHKVHKDDGHVQFVHTLFDVEKGGENSPALSLFESTLKRLKAKKLYRIKANLTYKTIFNRSTPYHFDWPNVRTSILYMNTNNGYTKFRSGPKVKSVTNRMVTFNSNIFHHGASCTNQKRRVVINFNYE